MTISNLWATLSGATLRKAEAQLDEAFSKLMSKIDRADGKQAAQDALRNMGKRATNGLNGSAPGGMRNGADC